MKLEYKINLRELLEKLENKYLAELDSSTGRYEELSTVADVVENMMSNPGRVFPYSTLGVEGDILTVPVNTSPAKVRLGLSLFEVTTGDILFDTTRASSYSIVTVDYSLYLGHKLTKTELKELRFIMNILRTGRTPSYEMELLEKYVDKDNMTAVLKPSEDQFLSTQRKAVDEAKEQYLRIGKNFSDGSPILPNKSNVDVSSPGAMTIAPLLVILARFLDESSISAKSGVGGVNAYGYDDKKYRDWREDILEPIDSTRLSESLATTGGLAGATFILQFLATNPGILKDLRATTTIEGYIDGQLGGPVMVDRLYSGRNETLYSDLLKRQYASSSDTLLDKVGELPMGTNPTDIAFMQLFANQLTENSLIFSLKSADYVQNSKDHHLNREDYYARRGDRFRDCFDIYETSALSLVPLEDLMKLEGVEVRRKIARPTQVDDGTLVDSNSFNMASSLLTRLENQELMDTQILTYSRHSTRVPTPEMIDFRSVGAFSRSTDTFSRRSVDSAIKTFLDQSSGYYAKQAEGYIQRSVDTDGESDGTLNPLATGTHLASESRSGYDSTVEDLAAGFNKLSREASALSKGASYKLDIASIRAAKSSVEASLKSILRRL